jgi:hypothetical protein
VKKFGGYVKREKSFSTQFIQFSMLRKFISNAMGFLALIFAISSCTNIKAVSSTASSNLNLANPIFGTSVGNFQLTTVLPSQSALGSLDLVGQGGEFATYCGTITNCLCEFTYQLPSVTGTTVTTSAIFYGEANLLRCTSPVSGTDTYSIRVVVLSLAAASVSATPTATPTSYVDSSNSISINLDSGAFAGSTSFLDLTNQASYLQVQRFQCRKQEFIPNSLDNSIIDPFQSSDPKLIYPFNYYTTNVSASLLALQQAGDEAWDCSLNKTQDGSLHWWSNPNVFSASACTDPFCSGDSQLIYPQNSLVSGQIPQTNSSANGKRRSSFALASAPYGVFQIPLKAAVAPSPGANEYVTSTFSVIGYAAKVVATSTGSACPNITLPPKATWVKLWNFRATDITAPTVVTSSTAALNAGIACNASQGLFQSCATPQTVAATATPFDRSLATTTTASVNFTLASRIGFLASSSTSTGTPADACYQINSGSWVGGAETWSPSDFGFTATSTFNYSNVAGLPWNIYSAVEGLCADPNNSSVFRATLSSCQPSGDPAAIPTSSAPSDTVLGTTTLNTGNNYSDHLFVTSDVSVNDVSTMSEYTPVTYRQASDCSGTSNSLCTATQIDWQSGLTAIDTPTGDVVYPLCVVQFYD